MALVPVTEQTWTPRRSKRSLARENGIPFFGICLGLQCATIEYARNVLGLANANSTEFNKETPHRCLAGDESIASDHANQEANAPGMISCRLNVELRRSFNPR